MMGAQLLLTAAAAPCERRKHTMLPACGGCAAVTTAPAGHKLLMRRSNVEIEPAAFLSIITDSSSSKCAPVGHKFARCSARCSTDGAGRQLLTAIYVDSARPAGGAFWQRIKRHSSSSSINISEESSSSSSSFGSSSLLARSDSAEDSYLGGGGASKLGWILQELTDSNCSGGGNSCQELLREDSFVSATVPGRVDANDDDVDTCVPTRRDVTTLDLGAKHAQDAKQAQGAKAAGAAPLRFSSLRARRVNACGVPAPQPSSKPCMRLLPLADTEFIPLGARPMSPRALRRMILQRARPAAALTSSQPEPAITPAEPVAAASGSSCLCSAIAAAGSGSLSATCCHVEFFEVEGLLVGKLLTRPDGSSGCYEAAAELPEEAAGTTYGLQTLTIEQLSLQPWAHVHGLRWEELQSEIAWPTPAAAAAAADDDSSNESGPGSGQNKGAAEQQLGKAGRRGIGGGVAAAAAATAKAAKASAGRVFQMLRARCAPPRQAGGGLDAAAKAAVREMLRLHD